MDIVQLAMPLLIGLIAVALAFDFLNGMNDAANSIATVVSTRVLRPLTACFAISTIALILCAELRAPLWTMLVSGGSDKLQSNSSLSTPTTAASSGTATPMRRHTSKSCCPRTS